MRIWWDIREYSEIPCNMYPPAATFSGSENDLRMVESSTSMFIYTRVATMCPIFGVFFSNVHPGFCSFALVYE
jgi:hypothetical protein